MKILVTGATGLVGRRLIHRLLVEGHEVRALARSPEKLPELPTDNVTVWDIRDFPSLEALKNCEAVVHLTGEGIADKRWTAKRKKKIWDSRITATRNLITAIGSLPVDQRPKALISASAIGYYNSLPSAQDEDSPMGDGFLPELCDAWEKCANAAQDLEVRTVILRMGLVLAKEEGILKKTGPIVLGDGSQWMSWVHINDLVKFIIYSIQNDNTKGPYNLTAPNPVRNLNFTETYAKFSGYPLTIKAPAFALRLALGELADVVLANQKILPTRTLATGFNFQFENFEHAIQDLVEGSSLVDSNYSAKQFIPVEKRKVFSYFSKAENLETITPPWLNFHIESISTPTVQQGSRISYKLKIHGIPTRWKSLISHWEPENFFVDVQTSGPYRKWHHLHMFEAVRGGTLISDDVTFQLPGGYLGKILCPLVRRDVQKIFKYRKEKINELSRDGQFE